MKRDRLVLFALLIIASVLAFEYFYLIPKSDSTREELESKYNALRKDEQYVKDGTGTEDEIRLVEGEMERMEKRMLREKTDMLALARLQGHVTDLAVKAGMTLSSIRPLSTVKLGKYLAAPVYFECGGTIRQFSDFLKYTEEDRILMKIDKLNINITNMQNPRDLKFKVQISALVKP